MRDPNAHADAVCYSLGVKPPDRKANFTRMANIKSQIKRNRQNEQRRTRNKSVRSRLRTITKRFEAAAAGGDDAAVREAYRDAARAYDQAAAKGTIHKNKAANQKARLARRIGS